MPDAPVFPTFLETWWHQPSGDRRWVLQTLFTEKQLQVCFEKLLEMKMKGEGADSYQEYTKQNSSLVVLYDPAKKLEPKPGEQVATFQAVDVRDVGGGNLLFSVQDVDKNKSIEFFRSIAHGTVLEAAVRVIRDEGGKLKRVEVFHERGDF
jgi:hypothetical protein